MQPINLQITKQLAVFLDNRPGTLARLCDILAKEKISIYAISTSDTIDHSVVRLVTSDPHKAMRLFDAAGLLVVDNDVLMLDGANRPGSLLQIAKTLAAARINIEYAYCATHPNANRGIMILRPNNVARALRVLNSK